MLKPLSRTHLSFTAICLALIFAAFPAFCGQMTHDGDDGSPDGIDRTDPDFVRASLLVMGPGRELWSCVGHAALRMECPAYDLDLCFSYESESVSDRLLTFFRGKLKMGMFAVPTDEFLSLYRDSGRGVVQYSLDLPPPVKQKLWKILDDKVAEGANLPYDYLKRGCAQSVRETVREAVAPQRVEAAPWPEKYSMTRREFVGAVVKKQYPWNWFFLNAICGTEVDRDVPEREKVILPIDLLEYLRGAKIGGKPIVSGTGEELLLASPVPPPSSATPRAVAWLLWLAAVVNIVFRNQIINVLFIALYAVAGLFFFYLVFVSDLPATGWNWLLVPFNLFPLVFWKWRRMGFLTIAAAIAVWEVFMLLSPHRLTDGAWLVLALAYAEFFVGIALAPSPARMSRITQ